MKKISIVIATWNAEKCLSKCLESIIPQLSDDIELIIIDGGSTDGTNDIINYYSSYISFTLSEKDKGVYDAWNKGIMHAKGEWIMFLGSDDILLPNAINRYIEYIETHHDNQYDIISSRLDLVSENGVHRRYVGEPFDHDKYCQRILEFAHPGLLHNRQIFNKYGLFSLEYKICADCDFFLKYGKNFNSGFVDFVSVRMMQGGISVSHRAIKEAYLIRKKYSNLSPFKEYMGYVKMRVLLYLSQFKTKLRK